MARILSYVLRYDDGIAPNPFGGTCTLTICKPVIRRTAVKNDWIVGIGATNVRTVKGWTKEFKGKLVYAMKVSKVLSLEKYDDYCKTDLKIKIPNITDNQYSHLGDCLYNYESGEPVTRDPKVHNEEDQKKDLRGKNALLSNEFYYFGDQAIEIDDQYLRQIIHQNQGHKIVTGEIVVEFENWLLKRGFNSNSVNGVPQLFKQKEKNPHPHCGKSRGAKNECQVVSQYVRKRHQ